MSDFSSELPIRSQLPGQVLPDDIIIKLGDGTNPTTQLAVVDAHGSQQNVLRDIYGNAIGDQSLSASYWLQVVSPANGPVSPGTAASYSILTGGVYNSAGVTLTTGQQASLQLDANGYLEVDLKTPIPAGSNVIGAVTQSGGPWTSNLTEVGGVALVLGQTTMSASIPVTIASDQSALTVNQGTSPWVISGTVTADQGGAWTVAATQSGAWTVAATQSGTWTVQQGSAPWSFTENSLGSATGGTAGTQSNLAGGIYNSTPPTLTNGEQAGLQLDAAGRLLVDAAVTFPYDENYGTVGATTLRTASQIGNATGAADFNNGATSAQTLRVAANLAVSGANVSVTNPVPVTITSASAGTPIQNFTDLSSIVVGGNATATYTVPATHSFSFERVFVSAENRIKIIVANNGTTIFTAFNSSACPNIDITVTAPPTIVAGNAVTVKVYNIDLGASDAYVTIEGNQIS